MVVNEDDSLQGRKGIDGRVMAVCDSHGATRKIILPSHNRAFADSLNVHCPA